jgi:RNA-splicing ligase RtcB
MEDAMREQQEKFREELRQQQMACLQLQSEYMDAYNAQAQQAMNVSVLFIFKHGRYLSYN